MEYVRECEESVDLLSGSVDSSWAAGKGRTNSSAGTGGIGPLMAIIGLPEFDLVLYGGALINFSPHPPLLHIRCFILYHVREIEWVVTIVTMCGERSDAASMIAVTLRYEGTTGVFESVLLGKSLFDGSVRVLT